LWSSVVCAAQGDLSAELKHNQPAVKKINLSLEEFERGQQPARNHFLAGFLFALTQCCAPNERSMLLGSAYHSFCLLSDDLHAVFIHDAAICTP